MSIEMFYVSDYEDPEDWNAETKENVKGVSIVSKEAYLRWYLQTENTPCKCHVQGCLSCFLDYNNAWTDGYGGNCSEMWFGKDPATGDYWNPENALKKRGYFGGEEK